MYLPIGAGSGVIAAVVRQWPPWFIVFYQLMCVFFLDLYVNYTSTPQQDFIACASSLSLWPVAIWRCERSICTWCRLRARPKWPLQIPATTKQIRQRKIKREQLIPLFQSPTIIMISDYDAMGGKEGIAGGKGDGDRERCAGKDVGDSNTNSTIKVKINFYDYNYFHLLPHQLFVIYWRDHCHCHRLLSLPT